MTQEFDFDHPVKLHTCFSDFPVGWLVEHQLWSFFFGTTFCTLVIHSCIDMFHNWSDKLRYCKIVQKKSETAVWVLCPRCESLSDGAALTITQYNTMQYKTIQFKTIQYKTIQYNTMSDGAALTIILCCLHSTLLLLLRWRLIHSMMEHPIRRLGKMYFWC